MVEGGQGPVVGSTLHQALGQQHGLVGSVGFALTTSGTVLGRTQLGRGDDAGAAGDIDLPTRHGGARRRDCCRARGHPSPRRDHADRDSPSASQARWTYRAHSAPVTHPADLLRAAKSASTRANSRSERESNPRSQLGKEFPLIFGGFQRTKADELTSSDELSGQLRTPTDDSECAKFGPSREVKVSMPSAVVGALENAAGLLGVSLETLLVQIITRSSDAQGASTRSPTIEVRDGRPFAPVQAQRRIRR